MSFDEVIAAPAAETKTGKGKRAPKAPKEVKRTAPSAPRRQAVVGGPPRVSLLPPEIKDAARTRVLQRVLVGAVGLTIVVTAGTVALANVTATAAADALANENSRTATLSMQVVKFRDIQALQSSIASGEAAVSVGTSTQIDWKQQVADITADMPSNYTVSTLAADSASVIADYPQGTSPLERPRAATVTVSVSAPDVVQLPIWLRKLRSIPAYADATANYSEGETGYDVTVVVHLSKQAIIGGKERAQ